MAELYVLSSIPGQGKTTTALLLEKKWRDEGKTVACLQNNKGQNDVGLYLKNNCFHYTVPLEGTRERAVFEQWLPVGYDRYILEISMPYSPFGAAYVDIFDKVNEVVSFEVKDCWKDYVKETYSQMWNMSRHGTGRVQDLMAFWDLIHDRKNQILLTKTPYVVEGPCVDRNFALHHIDELVFNSIQPRMKFPRGKKKVIAFGAFPGEFWDIFPKLEWFWYNPCAFQRSLKKGDYDMAVIGRCSNSDLKFSVRPDDKEIICYQPTVYKDLKEIQLNNPLTVDYPTILSTIKCQKPGTSLCSPDEPYCGYNNRFWVRQKYSNTEPVWNEQDILFCDGWILPQYLIKEGLLEV